MIHRQEQLLSFCFNYTLHSDHLTFTVCLCCLYWVHITWLIASRHVAWNDRDVVHCVRLNRGHLKWCWVFQCGFVDHGLWPHGMSRHFNIKPVWQPPDTSWLVNWHSQWRSVTVGQFGEPVSDSSKTHINQSINRYILLYRTMKDQWNNVHHI